MIKLDDGFLNVPFADTIGKDETRLSPEEIRDMQDAHNVNMCDSNDETWFDTDPIPTDMELTVIDELEFWERYGD